MSNSSDYLHPEIDRDYQRQKAFRRYRRLKSLEKSELSLDEQLFLENFEAAMYYRWGFPNMEIISSLKQ